MHQAISGVGIFLLILIAWLMSSDRTKINWRLVGIALLLQFVFALVIILTPPGEWLFKSIGNAFVQLLDFVSDGSSFVFSVNSERGEQEMPPPAVLLRTFAFGVMPTVIFFSSLMAILYHLGVMQWIVYVLAKVMQKTLGTSGAESLAAAANVFVGHTEAPLVVRPYIGGMTHSELHALMVGGFATISGGLLAVYVGMGIDPSHLLTASVISAPASLLISKILRPETQTPQTSGQVSIKNESEAVNALEAAAIGATEGLKLALNIVAMLIAFLALIALADALLREAGHLLGFVNEWEWSIAKLLGYAFAPIAFIMGIEWKDCIPAGELLGLKMVANEFIAFEKLGSWTAENSEVVLEKRSQIILTYALSGFSNFGAIGIQIGGIGGLAPERRSDLARFGVRAMIGGALACCMTACIAGLLVA